MAHIWRRYLSLALLDLAVVAVSYYVALGLRFSGELPGDIFALSRYARTLVKLIGFIALVYVLAGGVLGLYKRMWQYASSQEILSILGAGGMATLVD